MTSAPFDKAQWAGKKIGLLGGSFNPAHEGHLALSEAALEVLDLDSAWWLVSPQNPLKKTTGLAPFDQRFERATAVAGNPQIQVMDLEQNQGFKYTVETLEFLKRELPDTKFVWLMGLDCLLEFDQWKSWEKIMEMVPFAIFARPGYSIDALRGKTAAKWGIHRLPEAEAKGLAEQEPPAWVYIEGPLVEVSATALRHKAKAK